MWHRWRSALLGACRISSTMTSSPRLTCRVKGLDRPVGPGQGAGARSGQAPLRPKWRRASAEPRHDRPSPRPDTERDPLDRAGRLERSFASARATGTPRLRLTKADVETTVRRGKATGRTVVSGGRGSTARRALARRGRERSGDIVVQQPSRSNRQDRADFVSSSPPEGERPDERAVSAKTASSRRPP